MGLSITELISQRSMLVILIAACTSARTAFEADNVVDAQLCEDLNRMIERSQAELEKLNLAIAQASDG